MVPNNRNLAAAPLYRIEFVYGAYIDMILDMH